MLTLTLTLTLTPTLTLTLGSAVELVAEELPEVDPCALTLVH